MDVRKFISDVGITFISSIVCLLLGFPLTILLGRYLGPDDLGLYRMVNTIFGVIMLFVTLGIPAAIVKYVAEYHDNNKKLGQLLSTGLIASLLLGMFTFVSIYLCAGILADVFHMPELSYLVKILAFAFPFSIVNNTFLSFFNGLRYMKKSAWISMVQSVSILSITFLLVIKYEVTGAIVGIVLSSVLTTLLLMNALKRSNFPKISLSIFLETSIQIITFGSKTLLANAINIINYQADILFIGYFMTKTDVGVYSVAVMFAKLIWLLPDSIQMITFPLISEYHAKKENNSIKLIVDTCMKYTCLFLMVGSTFFIFFGKRIIDLIFGFEFDQAYIPLIILLIGAAIYGITKSVGSIFASVGKIDLVYKIPLVSATINIILNSFLIPIYGINGAAFATSFSLIIGVILTLHFMTSILNIQFDLYWYLKVFGVSTFMICIYFVNSSTSYLIVGSILITLQCIIFYRYFISHDHKKNMNVLIKKQLSNLLDSFSFLGS